MARLISLILIIIQTPFFSPNLVNLSRLEDIKLDEGLTTCKLTTGSESLLKIQVGPILRKDPSIILPPIKVKPGVLYSFLVSAEPHAENAIAHQVMQSGINLVWPGAPLKDGISMTQFVVPDSVSEVTVGFAFLNALPKEYILIRNIALLEGEVIPEEWNVNKNNSLSSALELTEEQPKRFWSKLSLMTLVSIIFLATVYLISKSDQ